MDRVDSPPPRFSDASSPRFTEHFNASPPYQPYEQDHQYHTFDGESGAIPEYGPPGQAIPHRLSHKEGPRLPSEVVAPHPELCERAEEEKEVVHDPVNPDAPERHTEDRTKRRRICGIPLIWLWLLVALLVAIAVGLGVGLGVGLRHHSSSSNSSARRPEAADFAIGGAINPQYFSTQGAFNGSGIALASQSFSRDLQEGTQGTMVMYFQHHTGQIRWQQLSNSGDWQGGDTSTIVATDARNSTPLSAVSHNSNGTSTWHVFYIDQNGLIKQRTNSNTTNVWVNGTINDLNLKVPDTEMVGMQACWYGNDYGDSNYTHTPLPNEAPGSVQSSDVGMHLWYATDNTTFQQYGWREGGDIWEKQETFTDKQGHAGVGCYSWGPGTVTYAMFVNLDDAVEFWWKDTATNLTSTNAHPMNEWTQAPVWIRNVHPSTSLGYTNFFYAQSQEDLYMHGYNISWAAENTTIVQSDSFKVDGQPGLPGTHLSVSAIPNQSGGDDLVVFYQTNGSDISEYTRDLVAGQWASVQIDIPQ